MGCAQCSGGTALPKSGLPLPLKTRGRWITDATGNRVRLKCASWSGAQEKWFVPNGLWVQHRNVIASMAKQAGLNCIRLVWSLEMVLRSTNGTATVLREALSANPDLYGRSPLQVLDAVIGAIEGQGMLIILDNHTSDAIWCCEVNDGNGLWYNARWSEQQWLQGWSLLAKRYASSSAVVGMGLRNEPRTLLTDSEFLVPTWGDGDPLTDLALAYEKAAAAVLAAKPASLIFVQGPQFGRDLTSVRQRPLLLRASWPSGSTVKNQLVYEVHEYDTERDFNYTNYAVYASWLDGNWGYIAKEGIAPIWLGEFGTWHNAGGISSPWWKTITRYIRENELDWSFWPLDGTQGPSRTKGGEEYFGLLNLTWNGFAYKPLIEELKSL